jgi:hypothetical protein
VDFAGRKRRQQDCWCGVSSTWFQNEPSVLTFACKVVFTDFSVPNVRDDNRSEKPRLILDALQRMLEEALLTAEEPQELFRRLIGRKWPQSGTTASAENNRNDPVCRKRFYRI